MEDTDVIQLMSEKEVLEKLAKSLLDVFGKDAAKDVPILRAIVAIEAVSLRSMALAERAIEVAAVAALNAKAST